MKSKDIIDVLNNIEDLLREEKYKEVEEYIRQTKINAMANENNLEDYIDEVISTLE